MLFVKEFPALLNQDRMPVNFRTFKAGIITLGRLNATDQMKMSRSVRAGGASQEDFETWIREKIGQAGMPKVREE